MISERELLPAIDIAVQGELGTFLDKIAVIAGATGAFAAERHFDALGEAGFHVLNLRYLKPSPHAGLGAQLVARPNAGGRIAVEARAIKWRPDPPTRECYCEATKALVVPLLCAYNRENRTRHRVRVEKHANSAPRLSPQSERLFQRFAVLANKSAPHPQDWQRFYRFVQGSRQELTADEARTLLLDGGFAAQKAAMLAEIYEHLWAFKRLK